MALAYFVYTWLDSFVNILFRYFFPSVVSRLAYNDLPAVLSRFWLVLDTALADSEESSWWFGHGAYLLGELLLLLSSLDDVYRANFNCS